MKSGIRKVHKMGLQFVTLLTFVYSKGKGKKTKTTMKMDNEREQLERQMIEEKQIIKLDYSFNNNKRETIIIS